MIVPGDPNDGRKARPDASPVDALLAAAIMHEQGKFQGEGAERGLVGNAPPAGQPSMNRRRKQLQPNNPPGLDPER